MARPQTMTAQDVRVILTEYSKPTRNRKTQQKLADELGVGQSTIVRWQRRIVNSLNIKTTQNAQARLKQMDKKPSNQVVTLVSHDDEKLGTIENDNGRQIYVAPTKKTLTPHAVKGLKSSPENQFAVPNDFISKRPNRTCPHCGQTHNTLKELWRHAEQEHPLQHDIYMNQNLSADTSFNVGRTSKQPAEIKLPPTPEQLAAKKAEIEHNKKVPKMPARRHYIDWKKVEKAHKAEMKRVQKITESLKNRGAEYIPILDEEKKIFSEMDAYNTRWLKTVKQEPTDAQIAQRNDYMNRQVAKLDALTSGIKFPENLGQVPKRGKDIDYPVYGRNSEFRDIWNFGDVEK